MSDFTPTLPYQLPVSDLNYRFLSSPNPYAQKLQLFNSIVSVDHEGEHYKGLWRSKFLDPSLNNPQTKLHVEIGCSTGHVMRARAAREPNVGHIGIEWKFKIVHQGAEKAIKHGLKNVHFLRTHAERLGYLFGQSEVDQFSVYFSDPWPKPSQHKNRILKSSFFLAAGHALKSGGIIDIRTDHKAYFIDTLEILNEFRTTYETIDMTLDRHQGNKDAGALDIPEVTLFEKIFIKQGLPIFMITLRKL